MIQIDDSDDENMIQIEYRLPSGEQACRPLSISFDLRLTCGHFWWHLRMCGVDMENKKLAVDTQVVDVYSRAPRIGGRTTTGYTGSCSASLSYTQQMLDVDAMHRRSLIHSGCLCVDYQPSVLRIKLVVAQCAFNDNRCSALMGCSRFGRSSVNKNIICAKESPMHKAHSMAISWQ